MINLDNILPDTTAEILKGRKPAAIGEIRDFNGKKYRKTPNGWRPVPKKERSTEQKSIESSSSPIKTDNNMTASEQIFIDQLGLDNPNFELVEACGNIWKAKGKTIYVRNKRMNPGAIGYLKTLNFIESAQEAGGRGVIQVKLK